MAPNLVQGRWLHVSFWLKNKIYNFGGIQKNFEQIGK